MAAEAAVSFLLNRLAQLIEKNVQHEFNLHRHADDSVQKLSTKLEEIQMVLEDAENKRLSLKQDEQGVRRVESWLQDLRNITYETEDALDEWEVEKIKQQLEKSKDASESDSWVEKVRSLLIPTCLCLRKTVHHRKIALHIEQLIARLDSLAQQNENELKFIRKLKTRHVYRTTTSFVDLTEIHGRDLEKELLLRKLLSSGSDGGGDGVKIISIVGAGGIGKTTLAQLLLKDTRVKNQFEEKLWICVSDPFNDIKIAKEILEVLDKESSRLSELQPLLESIEKAIHGKRFFLVLDDVWTEDDVKWKPLKECLKSGASGSRILVTTRKTLVAQIMGSTGDDLVDLKGLKDEDCWYILKQIAFKDRIDIDARREKLEKIGWEIAEKCKGSPLIAKTMGSLLRFNEDWESVLQSDMWKLKEVRNDIFPLLKLSYDELQPEIKRCFSYCAIFPKDKILEVEDLVRMWMAQGFVLPSSFIRTKMELEELGLQYFMNLASRSFFQDFKKDEYGHIIECKMHDIVHDFAQFLTNNECLIVKEVDRDKEIMTSNVKVVRHLTIISLYGDNVVRESLNLEVLRSFIHGKLRGPNLFTHLKRVRLLAISSLDLKDIPKEIGKLIHLRYLRIDFLELEKLPKTVCDLYNLQTLDISQCRNLCGLPQGIQKLRNLRHLFNRFTTKFPQGFENLVNLRHLDVFWATRDSGNELGLLKDLNHLEGKLEISIDDEVNVMQADKANLINKKRIQQLDLYCEKGRAEVIEALQPHDNLQSLIFENKHWPTWIGTLTKLRSLKFLGDASECMGDFFTYSITLSFLEHLTISNSQMERLWVDEAWTTAFPELKTLEFTHCWRWRKWEDVSEEQDITVFPKLKELILDFCHQLMSLPHRILGKAPSLEIVDIAECQFLEGHYGGMRKEDWEKISSTSVLKIARYRIKKNNTR